jgi:hypothetical protein
MPHVSVELTRFKKYCVHWNIDLVAKFKLYSLPCTHKETVMKYYYVLFYSFLFLTVDTIILPIDSANPPGTGLFSHQFPFQELTFIYVIYILT